MSRSEFTDLRETFAGLLITDADGMSPYLTDWSRSRTGKAQAVAIPDSTEDVASVVRWCASRRIPIVPQGGNTGLAGGATPDDQGDAIVLSLGRLRRIRDIDLVNDTITVDAGCVLQSVQEAASKANRFFPLRLGAQGSCTIGGNLATNAGGTNVLRYGMAKNLCLGIEVVAADGAIWNGLRGLRKDNTGYSLRDLFIGSEGTLGIITGAVMKLFPEPLGQVVAFASVDSPSTAVELYSLAKRRCDSALTAFELLSEECLALVLHNVPSTRRPFEHRSPWYVLIEFTDLGSDAGARSNAETLLMEALEQKLVADAVIAESTTQQHSFWALREVIAEAIAKEGKPAKHDVSVPISRISRFIVDADTALAQRWPGSRVFAFGHLGDGNIHYNVVRAADATDAAFQAQSGQINMITHAIVRSHGGSISAEHGLGTLRRDEADRHRPDIERHLMRALKQALDPMGIMNPGKVLPRIPPAEERTQ